MTMPARTVGNKTFLAGGSGLCSLFFDGTHYEKSARSYAKSENDHAACEDVEKQRIEHLQRPTLVPVPPPPYRHTSYCFVKLPEWHPCSPHLPVALPGRNRRSAHHQGDTMIRTILLALLQMRDGVPAS
jgi:hypothetical protein